jgi:hypothetical protein
VYANNACPDVSIITPLLESGKKIHKSKKSSDEMDDFYNKNPNIARTDDLARDYLTVMFAKREDKLSEYVISNIKIDDKNFDSFMAAPQNQGTFFRMMADKIDNNRTKCSYSFIGQAGKKFVLEFITTKNN